jgi:hypothetical protein
MHDAHDSIVTGHLGIDKTIASIWNRFMWDGMSKDFAEYIRSCDRCQRNMPTPSKPIGLLQPLEVPSSTLLNFLRSNCGRRVTLS